MKRFNLIFVVSIVMVILFSAFAFGAQSITGGTSIGTTPFTPSNNVCISVASDATQFGATSAHLNGNLQYGTCGGSNLATSCDAAKIYKNSYASGGTLCGHLTQAQKNGGHITSSWSPL